MHPTDPQALSAVPESAVLGSKSSTVATVVGRLHYTWQYCSTTPRFTVAPHGPSDALAAATIGHSLQPPRCCVRSESVRSQRSFSTSPRYCQKRHTDRERGDYLCPHLGSWLVVCQMCAVERVNIDLHDSDGWTPLHHAAADCDMGKMVSSLMLSGC